VVLVPQVSGAPRQLRPAPVLAVVVRQGAVVHHRRDIGEHALQGGERCCCQAAGACETESHLPLPGQNLSKSGSSARRSNNSSAAQSGREGRTMTPRLIFYIKLLLNGVRACSG